MALTHRKIRQLNVLDAAVLSRGQWHFQKLLWNYMMSHPTYQGSLCDLFQVVRNGHNELRELIQIQSINTPQPPSKDVKRQGASVAAFTSVITCK